MRVPSGKALALAALALFAILVAAGVHGLSIGCWDDPAALVPDTAPGHRYRQLGTPRWERADDWNVSVPQILAQCASPDFFPRVNPRVDLGRDMAVSTPCNPVWDATAPAQPHNWGFFLLGAERGFAWSWWLRFLGLPLCAFLALRPRLGGDAALAATGAAALTLGAPTQWWDTSLPYLLLYGFASLLLLDLVLGARRPAARAAAALGLACSLPAYFLAGYPPFAALLLPVFVLLALPGAAPRYDAPAPRAARLALALSLAAAAALVATYLALHAGTLRLVAASSYPGARTFAGGSPAAFLRAAGLGLLGPALPFESLRPDLAPFGAPNACAAARWYAPALALAVALCLRGPGRPALCDRLLPAWAAILALWAALPWPAWLARATGFARLDPRRAAVALGFALLLASLRLLARRRAAPATGDGAAAAPRGLPAAVAALAAALALAAIQLPGGAAAFPSRRAAAAVAIGGAAVAAAASWGLLAARRAPFCIAIAALSVLSGATVHPLAAGLAPLRDKQFAELARSIDAAEPGRWMANTSTTGNFLLAQGLDCIAGAQAYAVPAMWERLDPEGRDRAAWDRYAHTTVDFAAPGAPLAAAAPNRDHLRYGVDEARIRALGVRHLVWSGKKLNAPWLRYDGRSRLNFFYTVLPAGSAPGEP